MAIFTKKNCELCGGKVHILTRVRIKDGYLCSACQEKLSQHTTDWERKSVAQVRSEIELREENRGLYAQFKATTQDKGGYILADEAHRWWVCTQGWDFKNGNPDVFTFEQISSYEPVIEYKEVDETDIDPRERGGTPRKPRQTRQEVARIYVRITVEHPYVHTVHVTTMDYAHPSEIDVRNGHSACSDIITVLDLMTGHTPQSEETEPLTAADELLKYKQLLDMGAISQGEYDAKKEQLLGL